MAAPGMIEIPLEDYDNLCRDSFWLGCLEAAGVDNWDGIETAMEIRNQTELEEAQSLENQS